MTPDLLERWVGVERDRVSAHLRVTLRPDPAVRAVLSSLSPACALAAVTNSALTRLDGALSGLSLLHDRPNFRLSLPTKVVGK